MPSENSLPNRRQRINLGYSLLAGLLWGVSASLHAQMHFNLAGTYKLDDFQVNNGEISVSFAGLNNIPLCKAADNDRQIAMLNRVRAGSGEIEVYSNAGSHCIADISAAPSEVEQIALVEQALKEVLPRSDIRLADFDKVSVRKSPFPELRATLHTLYVPYGKIAPLTIQVYWRKNAPGEKLHYGVSIIHAYRNTTNLSGYTEITQGFTDFETLPYTSTQVDPALLATIKAADQKHALGLLKPSRKRLTDIVILEKPDAWLVKRIEHGECSEDRIIRTLKIDRARQQAILPVKTETLYGGECPD